MNLPANELSDSHDHENSFRSWRILLVACVPGPARPSNHESPLNRFSALMSQWFHGVRGVNQLTISGLWPRVGNFATVSYGMQRRLISGAAWEGGTCPVANDAQMSRSRNPSVFLPELRANTEARPGDKDNPDRWVTS